MELGIRVNSIMPGIFATPLMLGAKPQVLQSLAASVPFPKRLGKPEEFGSLAMDDEGLEPQRTTLIEKLNKYDLRTQPQNA